jgi:hypothetical protein
VTRRENRENRLRPARIQGNHVFSVRIPPDSHARVAETVRRSDLGPGDTLRAIVDAGVAVLDTARRAGITPLAAAAQLVADGQAVADVRSRAVDIAAAPHDPGR